MATPKLSVGISMLSEAREGEFSTVKQTLDKLLANIVAQPTEAKVRHATRCTPSKRKQVSACICSRRSRAICRAMPWQFRKIRTTNPKIGALLATRGVRAILIGAGFVEEGEFLVLPEAASAEGPEAALAALAAQAVEREQAESARKASEIAARKENQDKENEERKRMKSTIADDAALRKEPGWKAKAAGVKDGKSITGCSDLGIGTGGGG